MEEHGPGRVHELALELGTFLPDTRGSPGMDRTEVGHLSWNLGTRINGIHWMNFLGPPVLGELGGASAPCSVR